MNVRRFYKKGAQTTIRCFDALNFSLESDKKPGFRQKIPALFDHADDLMEEINGREPVFFFDYDGTLSPIVRDPGKAFIGKKMKSKLAELANHYSVSVVSGRDKGDIEKFIELDRVIYAGSHGFRIEGPDNLYMEQAEAKELLPRLDQMEKQLEVSLEQKINGLQVERKYFAIAIHYRNAPKGTFKKIKNEVYRMIDDDPDFKTGRGKKILEIKPSLNWHKGRAIEWIINRLDFSVPEKHVPIYVGDDVTDEDAFRAIADTGIGILVGKHSQLSSAKYKLSDVSEVEDFMDYFLEVGSVHH